MDTAGLIREARELARLSQSELADRAGTSQPAVSRYESGLASPSVATLDRLLAAAGARLDLRLVRAPRRLDARTARMTRVRAHRSEILAAAHRHGARNVRVFGSVARGEDGPGSDVDVLVDMDVETVGLLPLDDLRLDLEAILGERVDVAAEAILAPHVAEHALAEAVAL
ncbi:helix-turn-helix domain-containing protein [Cellulomonas endometrii]|uniref:helix-turn-helix domain-containing protein n=1 Tax=Cellulomonas endometrii TaxID=3036301 RepID=UPI0024AE6440|nr:XRE family transcriptional regulator [Cellulomonas endometrii]